MITIIHGEDTAKSRKYFIEQKQRYIDIVSLNGGDLSLTDMMQVFEGNGLFAEEKYVFIEDFFAKKKAGKETDEMIALLNTHQTEASIYLWESKDLTSAQLKKFPKALISQFKLPQMLFVFLDAIKPNNGRQIVQLFHQTLIDQDVQFLFVMLIRQFRLLLALSDPIDEPINELKRMSPWQKGKLQKQVKLFSKEQLKGIYQELYRLEHAMKTGGLTMSLEQSLDFFLLGL